MIAKREAQDKGHARTRSMPEDAPQSPPEDAPGRALRALEDAAAELDSSLTRGASNHAQLAADVDALLADSAAVRPSCPRPAAPLLTDPAHPESGAARGARGGGGQPAARQGRAQAAERGRVRGAQGRLRRGERGARAPVGGRAAPARRRVGRAVRQPPAHDRREARAPGRELVGAFSPPARRAPTDA
jgi:hypothetical protein